MGQRKLRVGTDEYTEIMCVDEPGPGGACHEYVVQRADEANLEGRVTFADVLFQKGPVKEVGVIGCHNEDLIAIVIDRLKHFQFGDYACDENEIALDCLKAALFTLRARTEARKARGVEGTSEK